MSNSEASPVSPAAGVKSGRIFRDEFFSERKGNLYLLALGLVVLLAALVTLLLFTWRHGAIMSALPIAIVMAAVALVLANHLNQRRRCAPAIRLERNRLRYLGGNPLSPRLIELPWAKVEGLENPHTSNALRLRLTTGKHRAIPIAMLSRKDRSRLLEAVQERVPVVSRRKRK